MFKEKISVIIPIYNGTDKIQRCLDSVFNQTYKNLEVVVVDDGSTDELLLALSNTADEIELNKNFIMENIIIYIWIVRHLRVYRSGKEPSAVYVLV